jgi:hypothetical protein
MMKGVIIVQQLIPLFPSSSSFRDDVQLQEIHRVNDVSRVMGVTLTFMLSGKQVFQPQKLTVGVYSSEMKNTF